MRTAAFSPSYQLTTEKTMDQPNILVVDDEPNILFILESTFRNEGYRIETATCGLEALEKIREHIYQLILLDLNMRPVDGLQVLAELRKRDNNTVVIILTAHSSMESAVEALHLGAFDYLFKPVAPDAIRQRVREGLKRYEQNVRRSTLMAQIDNLREMLKEFESEEETQATSGMPGRFIHQGPLVVDLHHRIVTLDGRLLDLTTTEFDLLLCLVEATPQPVAPTALVDRALGYHQDSGASEIIKWHIHQLRQKIEGDPAHPSHIKTVRYKGYMWVG